MKPLLLIFSFFILLFSNSHQDNSYELGRGYTITASDEQSLHIAGHISTVLSFTENEPQKLSSESLGLMLYGDLSSSTCYLIEYGGDDLLVTQDDKHSSKKVIRNRLYIEQELGEEISLKIGQFLTPIGIWNPTYISALRSSINTPFVADDFFPKIITGLGISGKMGESSGYSLFYHTDKETDQNKAHIRARDFMGGELFYEFGLKGRIALPFGKYKSFSSKDESLFSGVNVLLPIGVDELSFEYLYMDKVWKERSWIVQAGYVQYLKKVAKNHFINMRAGIKHHLHKFQDDNVVMGYMFRPKRSSALKLELRHHSLRAKTDEKSNDFSLSYSVLF
jgi:hypothetical protein